MIPMCITILKQHLITEVDERVDYEGRNEHEKSTEEK